MEERIIYFDHAATTPVRPEVLEEMVPYFSKVYGNPSSIYSLGREAKKAIEKARERTAAALNALPEEIYFTGSGTEADNWAIKGTALANSKKGRHIITSSIEHHAVLHTCEFLRKQGFDISYVPVDSDGIVHPEEVEKLIRDDTILISIMAANNEIGTVQPIREIGAIARKREIPFHTDAVQAIGNLKIDVNEMNIDMLSLSAHKFYGPKGVGVLYIKKGKKPSAFIHGGGQERKNRAGTENVAGIVGLGKAIELAYENLDDYNRKLIELRDATIRKVIEKIPHVRLNGHPVNRLPGNVNFSLNT